MDEHFKVIDYIKNLLLNSTNEQQENQARHLLKLAKSQEENLMVEAGEYMAGSEKLFENKIKTYLKNNGCWYIKYFANRMTKSGIPDILACINGYFVAIEVKADRGKPSELQIYHREQIRKAGGISLIVYPNQFEDLKQLIDDLIKRPEYLDWREQNEFDRE